MSVCCKICTDILSAADITWYWLRCKLIGMWKEASVMIMKISLEDTENLAESSIITVEIRNGFYHNVNKYYSKNLATKCQFLLKWADASGFRSRYVINRFYRFSFCEKRKSIWYFIFEFDLLCTVNNIFVTIAGYHTDLYRKKRW
jgi:hypothetical protein